VRRAQRDEIANANVLERSKDGVTMGRDGGVTRLPRPRRIRQMADAEIEGSFVVVSQHRSGDSQARDLEQPNQTGIIVDAGQKRRNGLRQRRPERRRLIAGFRAQDLELFLRVALEDRG
jgi:hypothetical protein